ncbi:MAG: hypothetical protein CMJ14_02255 [Pelagibacterales bacterium]|nr:hypothetical protein [Pelagibacterales bacterium]|tara:strand:+ start:61 stop:522 length:462 start_codon:yes stop_codon:yes gene_type:complete
MKNLKVLVLTLFTSFLLVNIALANSGSFNFHTGFFFNGDVLQISENQVMGAGKFSGVTFNDKGSGYLHNGEAHCLATFNVNNGVGEAKGWCSWSDNDGDRLFTSFNGSLYEGENIIIGGTGKYSGMTGSGPWACEDLGNNGSSRCWQTINYKK